MGIGIQVTVDAADPGRLADFWALALDYVPQPPPPGFDSWSQLADELGLPEAERDAYTAIVDPDGSGPRIFFQRVPEPKTAKNRLHLDVNVAAGVEDPAERWQRIEAHTDRLTAAGATELARFPDDPKGAWVVLADPEGNELCVQ